MLSFFTHFGSGNKTPGNHWLLGIGAATTGFIVAEQFLLFRGLRAQLEKVYSRQSWWDYVTSYRGLFCDEVQKEVQYISILGFHHLVAGGLMLKGFFSERPEYWAAGAILELADDIHDAALMILQKWPFGGSGKVDVKLTSVMLIHHMAGILAIVPCLTNGLHTNKNIQKIGAALLFAGGVSCVMLSVTRTRDRRLASQARQSAALWTFNWCVFVYCRFYVFPLCMLDLYREEFGNMTTGLQRAFVAFGTLMSIFSSAILVDATGQTVSSVKLAWKLTTQHH